MHAEDLLSVWPIHSFTFHGVLKRHKSKTIRLKNQKIMHKSSPNEHRMSMQTIWNYDDRNAHLWSCTAQTKHSIKFENDVNNNAYCLCFFSPFDELGNGGSTCIILWKFLLCTHLISPLFSASATTSQIYGQYIPTLLVAEGKPRAPPRQKSNP